MLMIRPEQMETLKQAAMRSFEQRMIRHLKQFFPSEIERASEERVRGAIRQGVYRAGTYGIISERDVARYIDLSVVLGLDFDSGKRYPWARDILARSDLDADAKLQALLEQTRQQRSPVGQASSRQSN